MQALVHLALALLTTGAPTLAAVVVVGIVLKWVGPIQLNLSIGNITPPQKPTLAKRGKGKVAKRASVRGDQANANRRALPPQRTYKT